MRPMIRIVDENEFGVFGDPKPLTYISPDCIPREGEQFITPDGEAFSVYTVEYHYGESRELDEVHLFCRSHPKVNPLLDNEGTAVKLEEAVNSVHGIEYLDRDSFKLVYDLWCTFDGLQVHFKTDFALVDVEAGDLKVQFEVGFNPETGMPQIGWLTDIPSDERLRRAVDVVVGLFFAVSRAGVTPQELFANFNRQQDA